MPAFVLTSAALEELGGGGYDEVRKIGEGSAGPHLPIAYHADYKAS